MTYLGQPPRTAYLFYYENTPKDSMMRATGKTATAILRAWQFGLDAEGACHKAGRQLDAEAVGLRPPG